MGLNEWGFSYKEVQELSKLEKNERLKQAYSYKPSLDEIFNEMSEIFDQSTPFKNPMYTTKHYFECHITLEPCFGERLELLTELCAIYGFRVADLLMVKGDKLNQSTKDSFCTARSKDFDQLYKDMHSLNQLLALAKFKVYRKKIENVLYDDKEQKDLL